MKQFEYKIEYLKLSFGQDAEEQVVEFLNLHGLDGWRMVRQYGEFSMRSISSLRGGIYFVLERELETA